MTATVTNWTLEIKGIKNMAEYQKDEAHSIIITMRLIFFIILGIILYDFIYYCYKSLCSDTRSIIIYIMAANVIPTIMFLIFFVILPAKNIIFTGISIIPTFIYVIFITELNLNYYDICVVNDLYDSL